jgi:hypothetical protein
MNAPLDQTHRDAAVLREWIRDQFTKAHARVAAWDLPREENRDERTGSSGTDDERPR